MERLVDGMTVAWIMQGPRRSPAIREPAGIGCPRRF